MSSTRLCPLASPPDRARMAPRGRPPRHRRPSCPATFRSLPPALAENNGPRFGGCEASDRGGFFRRNPSPLERRNGFILIFLCLRIKEVNHVGDKDSKMGDISLKAIPHHSVIDPGIFMHEDIAIARQVVNFFGKFFRDNAVFPEQILVYPIAVAQQCGFRCRANTQQPVAGSVLSRQMNEIPSQMKHGSL